MDEPASRAGRWNDLVALVEYSDEWEAEVVAAALRDAGLRATLSANARSQGVTGGTLGMRAARDRMVVVLVPAPELVEAQALLAELATTALPAEFSEEDIEEWSTDLVGRRARKRNWLRLLVALAAVAALALLVLVFSASS